MQPVGMKRTLKNRTQIRAELREELYEDYVSRAGHEPIQQCEDRKSYDSQVLFWLEPLIQGDNVMLIETEKLDGQITFAFEPFHKPIRVFCK